MTDKATPTTGNNIERVSLRDYVDVRFEAVDEKIMTAGAVLNTRLESMNEFRSAITDQARTFMTKSEYLANHRYLEDDVKELSAFMSRTKAGATQNQVLIAYALAVIGMLVGIVGHFLK